MRVDLCLLWRGPSDAARCFRWSRRPCTPGSSPAAGLSAPAAGDSPGGGGASPAARAAGTHPLKKPCGSTPGSSPGAVHSAAAPGDSPGGVGISPAVGLAAPTAGMHVGSGASVGRSTLVPASSAGDGPACFSKCPSGFLSGSVGVHAPVGGPRGPKGCKHALSTCALSWSAPRDPWSKMPCGLPCWLDLRRGRLAKSTGTTGPCWRALPGGGSRDKAGTARRLAEPYVHVTAGSAGATAASKAVPFRRGARAERSSSFPSAAAGAGCAPGGARKLDAPTTGASHAGGAPGAPGGTGKPVRGGAPPKREAQRPMRTSAWHARLSGQWQRKVLPRRVGKRCKRSGESRT